MSSNSAKRNEHENVHILGHEAHVAESPCPRCHGVGDIHDKRLDEDVPCGNCDGMGTILNES